MAEPNPLLAGTCYFSLDGQRWPLVGEFTYRCSGETREFKVGMDGPHGVKVKPIQGQIKMKLRNLGNMPIATLNDAVNATAIAELINGKTVVGRNMVRVGDPVSADAEEGEIEITFEGPDVTEQ